MPPTSDGRGGQETQQQNQRNSNRRGRRNRNKKKRAPEVEKPINPITELEDFYFQKSTSVKSKPFAQVERALINHFVTKITDQAFAFRSGYRNHSLPPVGAEPVQSNYAQDVSAFQKAHDKWVEKVEKRQNAEAALITMIEQQCTPSVMDSVMSDPDYQDVQNRCDSMQMLLLVQKACAERAQSTQTELSRIEAERLLTNFRQGKLSNNDYYEHFTHRAEVAIAAQAALGASRSAIQEELVLAGQDQNPTNDQLAAAELSARERYLAVLFLENAADRYAEIYRDLKNQKAMFPSENPYPDSVKASLRLINNWTPAPNTTSTRRSPQDRHGLTFYQQGGGQGRGGRGGGRQPGGGRGRDQDPDTRGRGREGRGRGRGGRYRRQQPQEEQDADEAHAHHQDADAGSAEERSPEQSDNDYSDEDSYYSAATIDEDVYDTEYTFLQSESRYRRQQLPSYIKRRRRKVLPKSWVILDTGSTASIFSNSRLLHGIHKAKRALIVRCNAGTVRLTHQGYFGSYPVPVWYNSEGIANILSFFEVNKHYMIDYHNRSSSDYVITTGNGIIRFRPTQAGLFYKDFAREHKHAWAFFETVKEQKSKFTKKDVRRAARARRIQNIIGRPGIRQFKDLIAKQLLPLSDLELRDINNAETIYGPNLGSLKGKTTSTTNTPVRTTTHDLPPHIMEHHSDVTLAIDIMFINKVPFLVTISRGFKFGTVEQLTNRQITTVKAMVQDVLALYERRGLKVNTILADLEFEPLKPEFPGINIDCCAKDDHVPEVERYIRTIKDRCRSVYNMLPFGRIPKLILRRLVCNAVFWLNSFPALDGVSATQSPRELITGKRINEKRHVRTEFGAYVQTHEEHDNSMQSRTIGAICLGPTGSAQGAHYFLNLATGSRIVRQHWTELPMPADVVQRVTALGAAQGMPKTLTFADRHGNELLDDSDDEDDDHDSAYSEEASDHSSDSSDDDSDFQPSQADDDGASDDDSGSETDLDDADSVQFLATRRLPDPPTAGVNNEQAAAGNEHTATPPHSPHHARRQLQFASPEAPTRNNAPALETAGVDAENAGVGMETLDTAGVDAENAGVGTQNAGVGMETPTQPANPAENAGVDDDASFNARLDATANELAQDVAELQALVPPTPNTAQANLEAEFDDKYGPRDHDHGLRRRKRPNFQHLHTMFHVQVCMMTDQMSAKKGLKVFGTQGADAIVAEMHQIHYRKVIKPIMAKDMTRDEKKAALKYLMFLKQKRCGKIKARGCADGRKQRLWKTKEETSAPTVRTESCFLSATIDAAESRHVMTMDVPGAFMHADIDELVHVKFEGELAELLIRVDPKRYRKFVTMERGKKVIYVELEKALYGTLQGALLFWKNLSSFLVDELGFKLNPYDSCVANKTIKGSQCTILWHVDDLKMSHKDPKVLEEIAKRLEDKYGTKEAPLAIQRGKIHEYLGMTIDYTIPGKVQFRMTDYIDRLLAEAPEDMKGIAATPAANHLFHVNKKNPQYLDSEQADFFHHMVAKLLYL